VLRDPVTGDWDFDGFIQFLTLLIIVCSFASLAFVSEGGSALGPYYTLYDLAVEHASVTIASFMIILMALWWYEQFRGGYF